jgi:hypothetical protein
MDATSLALENAAICEDLAIQLASSLRKVMESNLLTFEEKEWVERRIAEVQRAGLGMSAIANAFEEAVKLQNPEQIPLTEPKP